MVVDYSKWDNIEVSDDSDAEWEPQSARSSKSPASSDSGPCGAWYDKSKYRHCEDGADHEGRLELITWDTPGLDESGEEVGWGACSKPDSDDLKRKFEEEFKGDEEKLFEYFPLAFRWTCCGAGGSSLFGCDHHGRGTKKCTCDFCEMGKPIPDRMYTERSRSPHGFGLDLPRGPDYRSYHCTKAPIHASMRDILNI